MYLTAESAVPEIFSGTGMLLTALVLVLHIRITAGNDQPAAHHPPPEYLSAFSGIMTVESFTPAPVAAEATDVDVNTSVIGRLSIHFFERGGSHKSGKPADQHGVEIRWRLSDTPPAHWDDLTHSDINTSSPYMLSFEYDMRRKRPVERDLQGNHSVK
jgi:hypothetical protein